MATLDDVIHGYWQSQPHPSAPNLTVGEYPMAMRMATTLKFGQGEHPTPQEADSFMAEFKAMNQTLQSQNKLPYQPEEFIHQAQQMARSSFAYHGRPPSMYEMARLRDSHPKEIVAYYGALPDEHYPTVPAAEMAKALHAATPWSQLYEGTAPNKGDAAYLYHSGQSAEQFYQARARQDGTNDSSGPHAGVPGIRDAGGPQVGAGVGDTGVGTGSGPPGRQQGVPQRGAGRSSQ